MQSLVHCAAAPCHAHRQMKIHWQGVQLLMPTKQDYNSNLSAPPLHATTTPAKGSVTGCSDWVFHMTRRLPNSLRIAMSDLLRLGYQRGHGKNDKHCSRPGAPWQRPTSKE